MAVVINPVQEITGLSGSGQTDETGTWNEDVDLTGLGVPSDASAVLVYYEHPGGGGSWIGFRDPSDDTAKSGWQFDSQSQAVSSFMVPVSDGKIDIYIEFTATSKVWVAGYWEAGAVEWLAAGSELTRQTTSANPHTWDFTADDPDAKGAIFVFSELRSDDGVNLQVATATSPTAYSLPISEQSNAIIDFSQWIVPLDSGQAMYVDTGRAGTTTYHIVGFIKQDITFIYDDNSGPTESPTGTTWKAGTYDYGADGIGCLLAPISTGEGYHALADATDPFGGSGQQPTCTAIMHTVESGWNYILESGTPTYEVFWFMGFVCSELLAPDTIVAIVNLSGAVTDIDEPVNTPDGNWLLQA